MTSVFAETKPLSDKLIYLDQNIVLYPESVYVVYLN